AHRRQERSSFCLFGGETKRRGIASHFFESIAAWFLPELGNSSGVVDFEQTELRSILHASRGDGYRNVRTCAPVSLDELAVVHSIQMISGQHQNRVAAVVVEVMKTLTHGIRGALKPIRSLGRDFSSKNLNEAIGESAEPISPRDVPVK